jgi:predicted PurR-regulated permease PerM
VQRLEKICFAIAAVAVFVALYFGRTVLAPVACALFIIALAWPVQRSLQQYLPKLVALAIVILATVVVFVAFGWVLAWAASRIGRWLVTDASRLQDLFGQLTAWLEDHGIAVVGLWAEHFNMRWVIGVVYGVTGRVNTTVGFWLVALLYVVLGLLEVDQVTRKLQAMPNQAAQLMLAGAAATAAKFRRYMLIRTFMSLATGALVWAFASLVGLQFAAEWGVIAFALNYIPFIGPFVATMLPTLFALAQFVAWQEAVLVFACLNIIQFAIGSYVEPRVSGNILSISPFVVLFSVFLWTFLWGLFGAFIGVPITIALLTFCAQHPSSRWLAELLGGPGAAVRLERCSVA